MIRSETEQPHENVYIPPITARMYKRVREYRKKLHLKYRSCGGTSSLWAVAERTYLLVAGNL